MAETEDHAQQCWDALRELFPAMPTLAFAPGHPKRKQELVVAAEKETVTISASAGYLALDPDARTLHLARAFAVALCQQAGVNYVSNLGRHYNHTFDAMAAQVGLYRPLGTGSGPLNHRISPALARHFTQTLVKEVSQL